MVLFELHLHLSGKNYTLFGEFTRQKIPLVFVFLKKQDPTTYSDVLQAVAEKVWINFSGPKFLWPITKKDLKELCLKIFRIQIDVVVSFIIVRQY